MKNTSSKSAFTTAQMAAINQMIADAVAQAVVATIQAMPAVPVVRAPAAPKTLAAAKASSWTERIHRAAVKTATAINEAAGATSSFAADKLSTLEVKAGPAVVKTTGIVCAKSAFTAVAIGSTLSSFADRCAAARVRMEFAK